MHYRSSDYCLLIKENHSQLTCQTVVNAAVVSLRSSFGKSDRIFVVSPSQDRMVW